MPNRLCWSWLLSLTHISTRLRDNLLWIRYLSGVILLDIFVVQTWNAILVQYVVVIKPIWLFFLMWRRVASWLLHYWLLSGMGFRILKLIYFLWLIMRLTRNCNSWCSDRIIYYYWALVINYLVHKLVCSINARSIHNRLIEVLSLRVYVLSVEILIRVLILLLVLLLVSLIFDRGCSSTSSHNLIF